MELRNEAAKLEREFAADVRKDEKLSALYKKVRDGTATTEDATEFASLSGKKMAERIRKRLLELYPEKKVSYEDITELLPPTEKRNYKNIAELYKAVQAKLNRLNGLELNAAAADYPEDRYDGINRLISEMDDIEEEFRSAELKMENASMSTVDDSIHENADYHSRLGLKTIVIREFHPEETDQSAHHDKGYWECPWCKEMEGTYDYDEVKDAGNDVWRRHDGCHCVITYKSEKKTDVVYNGIKPRAPDRNVIEQRQRQGIRRR